MVPSLEQRRLLGDFLRARREALSPAQAATPSGAPARRRTPGLRREEVAQLCGISATWYTWLEQGRDISLSAAALARLANASHLSGAERAYMFELARKRDPAPLSSKILSAEVPPALAAALSAIRAPAYLLDRRWVARAWNDAAAELFAPWFGSHEASLLRYVFLDPGAQTFIYDWENRAQRLLAEFRADTAQIGEDPGIRQLVEALSRDSPAFVRLWNNHTVLAREGGERMFNHPQKGRLQFEQITFVPAAHPDHKLVMLVDGLN